MKESDEMLLLAASTGMVSTVKLALEMGADINVQNEFFKEAALHEASSKGFLDVVKILVENGADILLLNATDMTPIHLAARDGQTQIVEFLLSKVGKVPERILNDIISVANMSATGRSEIAEILSKFRIQQVAPTTDGMKDTDGMLLEASESGDFGKVKTALESGANVEETDSRGMKAIVWAGLRGHFDIVKILLEKGADVNGTNSAEWTALMQASANGHVKIVKLLLEQGAEVNMKTFVSGTALMFASGEGHLEIVKMLLEKGADPTIIIDDTDDYGMTAWAYARRSGHTEIVELLEKAKENWNA